MPPKTWFSGGAAGGAAAKTTHSVLDDAPALPGAGAPASAAPSSQQGKQGYRPANAWTGKPDSRAEQAAATMTSAPELAVTPEQPKPEKPKPEKRPVATPMP
eukprot:CAMPEP_0174852214 /NCGR_PEP_ID=MMETSP1114-20130205/25249_1 /TAXON_ID=312471 /ORGANISM="Neobodo designis, Strain CCAP 1951/1" /LENGTH=101 /DNA_ID=CAMNT_0016086795 /DNA_START=57 /DNA_END=359 /DNA_ORIENTATION=+